MVAGRISPQDAERILDAFKNINRVLNVFEFSDPVAAPDVQEMLRARDAASYNFV